jgi:DNA polymerase sigma
MSIVTTEFLRLCCAFDPRVKMLCLFLKYWAHRYRLTGSCVGTPYGRETIMSNYALYMMIIFFLQKEEILPTVKELQVKELGPAR